MKQETRLKTGAAVWLCMICAVMAGLPGVAGGEDLVDGELVKVSGEFKFTEGPAADAEGNVYFTDQPNNRIMKYAVNGTLATWMQPAGRANGLCVDAKGRLWACADEDNELWRIDPADKKVTVVLGRYDDKRLNGPNDLWITADGGVYFTDPFYNRKWWSHSDAPQDGQCVYYLPPGSQQPVRVADDLEQPNGIIGTADGKMLYVADIKADKTYCYQVGADGQLSDKQLFCAKGSDGMTIDERGNLYLTHKGGVFVFDPKGEPIRLIAIDEPWTANVCFGGKDRKTLLVTAMTGLYSVRMQVAGVGSQ